MVGEEAEALGRREKGECVAFAASHVQATMPQLEQSLASAWESKALQRGLRPAAPALPSPAYLPPCHRKLGLAMHGTQMTTT